MEESELREAPAEYQAENKPASFPAPVLTREQWAECRRAVEAGLEMKEAAEAFGVDYQTVKQRAYREKWLHDARIKQLAEEVKAKEAAKVAELSPAVTRPVRSAESALETVAASLEGYRSRTLLGLAKLAEKGVERAIDANLEIENWQDAKIAADIALKLHQVGQESVQVNICNAFADMDEGKLVETEAEEIADEGSRDSYFIDAE